MGCNERFKAEDLNNEFLYILRQIKPSIKSLNIFKKECNFCKLNDADRKSNSRKSKTR